MNDIERLEQEVMEMNDFNVYTIFNHIKDLPELQTKFSSKEKNIQNMYKYICDKASYLRKGNVAMVNDNIVYKWAENYFKYTNKELGIKEEKIMTPSASQVIKKTEKQEETKQDDKKENQISIFKEVT